MGQLRHVRSACARLVQAGDWQRFHAHPRRRERVIDMLATRSVRSALVSARIKQAFPGQKGNCLWKALCSNQDLGLSSLIFDQINCWLLFFFLQNVLPVECVACSNFTLWSLNFVQIYFLNFFTRSYFFTRSLPFVRRRICESWEAIKWIKISRFEKLGSIELALWLWIF